jgi:hypothetical protein
MTDITTRLRQYGNTGEPLLLQEDTILEEAAGEIERLRLTDEEREAIEWAAFEFDGVRPDNGRATQQAATLRGLLERLGGAK